MAASRSHGIGRSSGRPLLVSRRSSTIHQRVPTRTWCAKESGPRGEGCVARRRGGRGFPRGHSAQPPPLFQTCRRSVDAPRRQPSDFHHRGRRSDLEAPVRKQRPQRRLHAARSRPPPRIDKRPALVVALLLRSGVGIPAAHVVHREPRLGLSPRGRRRLAQRKHSGRARDQGNDDDQGHETEENEAAPVPYPVERFVVFIRGGYLDISVC